MDWRTDEAQAGARAAFTYGMRALWGLRCPLPEFCTPVELDEWMDIMGCLIHESIDPPLWIELS